MATLSPSGSRRLYSWWWDSHISPKNSKWLQENLTDMDSKVKAMIKLIEEDADSFARRAEMYYKKRPELMKLVEEFYRAYRALAERYDHATLELRQAHRTMVQAFPDEVSYALGNDSTSGSLGPNGEPHTPELLHPIRSLLDSDDLQSGEPGISSADSQGIRNRGLRQLGGTFSSGGMAAQISKFSERMTKRVAEGEMEVQFLKKVLTEIKAEKDAVVLQYQKSLQKLSSLEKELKDAGGLDERASRAEIEIRVLKEALEKLEAERDASHLQLSKCLEKILSLEDVISKSQEETNGLHNRAFKADVKAQNLMKELSSLEAEKEASLLQYNQCLEMIFILRNRISSAEENARLLHEQTEKAEAEARTLKQALSELNEEKDDVELQYEHCLGRIAKLESEISLAHEDVERLNTEVMTGAAKLKNVEEQRDLLERSNQSLQLAATDLVQKISIKDQELSQKENELERLQSLLKDEQSRFGQVEATLQALQILHSQCQDKQTALAIELENKLRRLKDLETCNNGLQGDLQRTKDENQCLNELSSTSSVTVMNLQNEISSLKELKEKLEEDLALQVAQTNSLQEEIHCLKEEIECLNKRYQALLDQLRSVGLNPEALSDLVRNMQEENSMLKEVCNRDTDEKALLHEKLKDLDQVLEKNVALEKSLLELNGKLQGSGDKIKELRESCHFLQGEKSGFVSEKAILLSQLQMMTENMQKLFEKNALAENSLSLANIELEGLRAKSKSLEELCQMLKDEKSGIINERNNLVSQLQNVELRLGNLEMRCSRLEDKCNDLQNDKISTLCQVKELQVFLGIEKQEHVSYVESSEFRMADLEKQVHVLQEERMLSKKEFEEELDKAVNAQLEIFVLQKFIEDLEDKNLSLLLECQKHVEASKLSNKLMAEFETENLEQQVEIEFLLDEIEKLRRGVHRVFKALQLDSVYELKDKFEEEEQIPFEHMSDTIKGLKFSLLVSEDEKQKMVVENLVLLTLIKQLRIDGTKLNSVKKSLDQELQIMTKQLTLLQKDKHELLEMNGQLKFERAKGEEQEKVLKGQLEAQLVNVVNLQYSYEALQEEHFKVLGENGSLLQKLSHLKGHSGVMEAEYNSILQEALTLGNLLLVFKCFRSEKGEELKLLYEDLSRLHSVNSGLTKKVERLEQKLGIEEAERLKLIETIAKLHQKLHERENVNDELNYQILVGKEFLREQAMELLQAQKKLAAAQDLNTELCNALDEMKRECAASKTATKNMEMQIHELLENCFNHQKEIERLCKTNEDTLSEVCILRQEVEERRVKEENLTLELQDRSNEFELCENEASSFYFDLQTSSIKELLIEDKVHELTSACEHLEEMNTRKDIEIEQMKERFGFLDTKIEGLKAQLSAYDTVIASLQDNVKSLEQNVLQTKPTIVSGQMKSDVDVAFQTPLSDGKFADKSIVTKDGVSDLLEMQVRIKAVEKAITQQENRHAADNATNAASGADTFTMLEIGNIDVKPKQPPFEEAEVRERRGRLRGAKGFQKGIQLGNGPVQNSNSLDNEPVQNSNSLDKEPEISECRNAILTKDIPLDEISDRSSHRRSRRESTETELAEDKMFDLWGSGEFDYNANPRTKSTRKPGAALSRTRSRRRVHRAAKHKRGDSSLGGSQANKEVKDDRLEVPRNSTEELNQEGIRETILERLESDAKKLISIQMAAQDLKRKMDANKKSKKDKNLELERVKTQLLQVDNMVLQLFGMTNQLARDIQQRTLPQDENISIDPEDGGQKIVTEQAQKGSEKIGRLQLEVERIRYSLLKLEDEKKCNASPKFPGSKTGILLRDFIYNGSRRNSRKGKKTCFCGCGRPLTHEE